MNNNIVYSMIVILMNRLVGFIMRVLKGDPSSTGMSDLFLYRKLISCLFVE